MNSANVNDRIVDAVWRIAEAVTGGVSEEFEGSGDRLRDGLEIIASFFEIEYAPPPDDGEEGADDGNNDGDNGDGYDPEKQ